MMLLPKYCSDSPCELWSDWFWNVYTQSEWHNLFLWICPSQNVWTKETTAPRKLYLGCFFFCSKCPFFRMGTELESKLNLNQGKQFSKHSLITHKYSHGSEDCLLEESVSEGIEDFWFSMVLELKGRYRRDIHRKIHYFFRVFFLGGRSEKHKSKMSWMFSQWDTPGTVNKRALGICSFKDAWNIYYNHCHNSGKGFWWRALCKISWIFFSTQF